MKRGNTWCLPYRSWPEQDRREWDLAVTPGAWLEDGGRGSRWRPKTRAKNQESYGHWLAYLSDQGWLDEASEPAGRVTVQRLTAYAEWMAPRVAAETARGRLRGLKHVLAAMAGEVQGAAFKKLLALLPRGPSRDKRLKVREPAELFLLGHRLMAQAEEGAFGPPRYNGVAFRDGLIIALAARRPLRRGNLAGLRLDTHLTRDGECLWIGVPGDETKTGAPIRMSWPKSLDAPLQRYLGHWRKILLGKHPENQAVWISRRGGRQLKGHTLACNFRRHTGLELNVEISPHRFRDAAATMMAVHDPANVRAAAGILGHRTYATTEQHYILAHSLEAARRYHSAFRLLVGEEP